MEDNTMEDKEIHEICEKYKITNYKINNGLVDVDGNVYLGNLDLTHLPLHFGEIRGYFNCFQNKLTTLKGCPVRVNGYFSCSSNELIELDYLPEFIGGYFSCHTNELKTFTNLEKCWLVGKIYCWDNPIHEIFNLFKDKDWNIGEIDRLNILVKDFSLSELNQWLMEEGYQSVNKLENYK